MTELFQTVSTRPYLVRAIHEWCTDNGFTPYIAVLVDKTVQVPREFVQDGQIVLNVSVEATSNLSLGNEVIEFKARFGGQPRSVRIPIGQVAAVYARENGEGMTFPCGSQQDPGPAMLNSDHDGEVAHRGLDGSAEGETGMTGMDSDEMSKRPHGNASRASGKPVLTRIK